MTLRSQGRQRQPFSILGHPKIPGPPYSANLATLLTPNSMLPRSKFEPLESKEFQSWKKPMSMITS